MLARLKKLRRLGLEGGRGVNDDNVARLARLPALRELDLRRTSVTRFRLALLLPHTKWKQVKMEADLGIGHREEREVEAFKRYCREHDVLVEVDYE